MLLFAPVCTTSTRQCYKCGAKHGQAVHKRTEAPVTVCIFAGNSKLSDMEIVTIEKKTFEELVAKFDRFVSRMDAICHRHGEKRMSEWMDNQDVCRMLNISHAHCRRFGTTELWLIRKSATRPTTSWRT